MNVFQQPCNGIGMDGFRHWKRIPAGMNDGKLLKSELLQCTVHGSCRFWAAGTLDLEARPAFTAYDQKIQLGAGVRGPKKSILPDGQRALQ